MKIFIRVLGIVLGLSLIGIGLYLNLGEFIWDTHGLGEVIEKAIMFLAIFFVAVLLLAPERIYQKTPVRNIACLFCIVLSIFGAFSILLLCSYFLSVLMDNPDPDFEVKMLFGTIAGILVPFASALVLCARVLLARKASRERSFAK